MITPSLRDDRHCVMNKYRSLVAWQRAREITILVMRSTDAAFHPRATVLFDQLRRAALSIELNIVEGYALATRPQFHQTLTNLHRLRRRSPMRQRDCCGTQVPREGNHR